MMMFQKDKNVLVIATKQETAKNMVTKVRFAYNNLPDWMRKIAKSTSNNQLSLSLSNGSQIKATAATGDAGRSEAVSLLVVDECVTGDTNVTIKNKITGKVENITINNLKKRLNDEI
jgi:phage terminase large subunit-like protein